MLRRLFRRHRPAYPIPLHNGWEFNGERVVRTPIRGEEEEEAREYVAETVLVDYADDPDVGITIEAALEADGTLWLFIPHREPWIEPEGVEKLRQFLNEHAPR